MNLHNESVYLLVIKRFMKSLFLSYLSSKIYELADIDLPVREIKTLHGIGAKI